MYSTLTAKKGRVDGRGCVDGGNDVLSLSVKDEG